MNPVLIRFSPRTPARGDEVAILVVVRHPMEPGTRRDDEGALIPADYITKLEVLFEGEHLASLEPRGGMSANPFFSFSLTAERPGEVSVRYTDLKGEAVEQSVRLELA